MTRLDEGEEVDRYVVEHVLGQGGAATVYAVRHQRLNSLHALKVMSVSTATYRKRLLHEGRGQAGLRHPNVVSVFDVLEVHGAPALLMEYVGGPTLAKFLRRGNYTVGQALWLFRGIVLGVGAAHRRGLIHRDLKPDNVLLAPTNDGLVPKVTDFGLVKRVGTEVGVTQAGVAVGTAPYMAPEQIVNADVDQRVDLWALGCILYELVCGRRPFIASNALDIFNLIRDADFVPPTDLVPDLPQAVDTAIQRLLVVDKERRIASCDELFELLFDRSLAPERIELDHLEMEEPDPLVLTAETTAPTDLVRSFSPSTSTGSAILAPLVPEPDEDLPEDLLRSVTVSADNEAFNGSPPTLAPRALAPDAQPLRSERWPIVFTGFALLFLIGAITATLHTFGATGPTSTEAATLRDLQSPPPSSDSLRQGDRP